MKRTVTWPSPTRKDQTINSRFLPRKIKVFKPTLKIQKIVLGCWRRLIVYVIEIIHFVKFERSLHMNGKVISCKLCELLKMLSLYFNCRLSIWDECHSSNCQRHRSSFSCSLGFVTYMESVSHHSGRLLSRTVRPHPLAQSDLLESNAPPCELTALNII